MSTRKNCSISRVFRVFFAFFFRDTNQFPGVFQGYFRGKSEVGTADEVGTFDEVEGPGMKNNDANDLLADFFSSTNLM